MYRATASHLELGITQGGAPGLCCREGLPGPGADQCAFLLCERGKEVQHERVHVWPKLCDQEGHLVHHEPTDETDVAAKTIQFGDRYLTPLFPPGGQSHLQLRPAINRVRTLPGLHLNELAVDLEPLCLGELAQGNPLGLNAQTRSALLRRRNQNVRDEGNLSTAIAALTAKAKLAGFWIERREQENTSLNYSISDQLPSEDEWEREDVGWLNLIRVPQTLRSNSSPLSSNPVDDPQPLHCPDYGLCAPGTSTGRRDTSYI